jgi:hypothetical protein
MFVYKIVWLQLGKTKLAFWEVLVYMILRISKLEYSGFRFLGVCGENRYI